MLKKLLQLSLFFGLFQGVFAQDIETINSGTSNYFNYVFFTDSLKGWTVGQNGLVKNSLDTGKTWNTVNLGTTEILRNVFFISDNKGWIVGNGGKMFQTTNKGNNWSLISTPIPSNKAIFAVHFVSDTKGWISGSNGTVHRTLDGGATWQTQLSIGSTTYIRSIYFVNDSTGVVVGDNGLIYSTSNSGNTWTQIQSNTTQILYRVYFVTDKIGWIFGASGTILKTTDGGSTWTTQQSGTTRTLYRCFFTSQNKGWAVGGTGTLITTDDGGESWYASNPNVTSHLYGIHFISETKGFAVGEQGVIIGIQCTKPNQISQSPIASLGNNQIDINFTPASNNGGFGIDSFLVISNPGFKKYKTTSSSISITSGLTKGQSYTFKVLAYNKLGESDSSVSSNSVVYNCYKSSSISISSCNSYDFNGKILTQSGIYTDTLESLIDCDSIISLNLTIKTIPSNPLPQAISAICGEGKVQIGANYNARLSGAMSSYYKMYDAQVNGIVVDSAFFDLTTPLINETKTFYVSSVIDGCESGRVAVTAVVNQPSASSINQTACDSYFFNGANRTQSGIYKDTLVNAAGCDSIITLNLTINSTPSAPTYFSADPICGSGEVTFMDNRRIAKPSNPYTLYVSATDNNEYYEGTTTPVISQTTDFWITEKSNGCESPKAKVTAIVNHATSSTMNHTVCGMYMFAGKNLTTSGIYKDTIMNAVGCDSVITLNLTINSVDTSVSVSGNTLMSNENGASYQWIDCFNGGQIVSGATNQNFTPTNSGDYAVVVTNANCSDTSSCHHVDVVITGLENSLTSFAVYPNPASDNVTITLTESVSGKVSIIDLKGNEVVSKSISGNSLNISTVDLASGVYVFKIVTANSTLTKKVVIK